MVAKDGRSEVVKVRKIYETDVRKINAITYNSVKHFFAFRNREAVSIEEFEDIHKLWMGRL